MNEVYGLRADDLKSIVSIIQSEKNVEEAILFGSRAKGNYQNGSDVDIALKGNNLSLQAIAHISYILNEETLMPYRFDLVNYHSLKNSELISHIDRVGKVIYSSGNTL